jgi:hypothetical protein
MVNMDEIRNWLPDLNRLSITVSTIILAYTLTNFITIPPQEVSLALFGILFNVPVNFTTLVALLVAGLTASGTAWLIYDHPNHPQSGNVIIHWLLPSLTSLVLMLAVNQLPFGPTWWIAAAVSGLGILLVLTAEFVVMDQNNPFYTPAEIGITAVSVALFLLLAVSLHGAEARLFYRVPILCTAALMVFLRIIHLRKNGIWAFNLGAAAFVLIGELAAGFHYLPIGSVGFGIALTGPLYALIEISSSKPERPGDFNLNHLFWPGVILILSWSAAIFF